MGQWLSQTRKMNKHYQSVNIEIGLIYNDWPAINKNLDLYATDNNGFTNFTMSTSTTKPQENKFNILIFYRYYEDGNFMWEETVRMNFNFATEKVKSANRIVKNYNGVDYNAVQVIIPTKMISDKSDEIFDATTEDIPVEPFLKAIDEIVITLTDVYNYERLLFVEYKGSVRDYPYVQEIINREFNTSFFSIGG